MKGCTEMETEKENDICFSSDQQDQIANIYKSYLVDIAGFISTLEVLDNEYPVGILNEIRAIFTHLARCYAFSDCVDVDSQIIAAERHIKRAKLDCYKYICVSHMDYIERFYQIYKNIDLTYIDNGEFVKELRNKTELAKVKIKEAKCYDVYNVKVTKDLTLDDFDNIDEYCQSICDDDLYDLYMEAYTAYSDCISLIKEHDEDIQYLVRKTAKKDKIGSWGLIIGIISAVLGIASLVISFIH